MPGWSTQIANEFIRLGANSAARFDQMQLQKLVYISHGWCLAITGGPLTGDRPEAWDFGPIYRRLADASARWGQQRITSLLHVDGANPEGIWSELDSEERRVIERVLLHYGRFSSDQLSALTRGEAAPWARVYGAGEGRFQDIPHRSIRDQFVSLAEAIREDKDFDRDRDRG